MARGNDVVRLRQPGRGRRRSGTGAGGGAPRWRVAEPRRSCCPALQLRHHSDQGSVVHPVQHQREGSEEGAGRDFRAAAAAARWACRARRRGPRHAKARLHAAPSHTSAPDSASRRPASARTASPAARAAPPTLCTAPSGSAALAARRGAVRSRGEASGGRCSRCRCPWGSPSPAAAVHLLRFGPLGCARCMRAARPRHRCCCRRRRRLSPPPWAGCAASALSCQPAGPPCRRRISRPGAMGTGWRVWKEKVRESLPGTHNDLTSNAR